MRCGIFKDGVKVSGVGIIEKSVKYSIFVYRMFKILVDKKRILFFK